MRRAWEIAMLVLLLGIAVVIGQRLSGGSSGASALYGGSLEPRALPDFPSLATQRWVNGAPLSLAALRGNVVLVEAWHPT